jgi:hypothetical protein
MNCYVKTEDGEVIFQGWFKTVPGVGEKLGVNPPGGYSDDKDICTVVRVVQHPASESIKEYALITVKKEPK